MRSRITGFALHLLLKYPAEFRWPKKACRIARNISLFDHTMTSLSAPVRTGRTKFATYLKYLTLLICLGFLAVAPGCRTQNQSMASKGGAGWITSWRKANPIWRGVHLMAGNERQIDDLTNALPKLVQNGVNVVVLEVDYNFEFQSHPEVRGSSVITKARAHELAQIAHSQGVRLIPQINCLGHQSWSKTTLTLLKSHPEFDETPGRFPDNKDIYCRSWCPQNP